MEVEITAIPPLDRHELALLNMHSLLNVLTVLQLQFSVIGQHISGDPGLLTSSLEVCARAKSALADHDLALQFARSVPEYEQRIRAEVNDAITRCGADCREARLHGAMDNLASILRVMRIRAGEILARAQTPDLWADVAIGELRSDVRSALAAIEQNSDGRYRITYNVARQQPSDYYVGYEIESARGPAVLMPLAFKDVVRDLIANARKYTPPGGTIVAGIHAAEGQLRFVVQDSGYGIPRAELETVVHFGRRGSNVAHLRTMGGGFGLTKAFAVAKQFNGRFWIKSDLGVGTRVSIVIPQPAAA